MDGYAILASDGRIGTVSDFLFDDESWLVRWLVVDTGNWLSGRKVLLPTTVLGHLDVPGREFSVRLTRQQVEDSPDIDTERPVSRQLETNVYDYYGWAPYWGGGLYMGGGYMGSYGAAGAMARPRSPDSDSADHIADARREDEDPHLRSINAVTGYHIRASDGEIGHVEDFLIEEADWSIHYLVVDTKNWWPAKKVLISPLLARRIDWNANLVDLDVDRESVKDSPEYDAAVTVDRAYERRFHDYYGNVRPGGGT
ncbi:MAG: PRC-barrel domain containing protein [Rhizobiaceae bacterium]|nr:MAG: PRC-barrel domain containing protein [Rhizobiaceae bacterium]